MRLSLIVAAALSVCSIAAHASNITYQINAPLSDGGLFAGTFSYDSTNVFGSTLIGATTNSAVAGSVGGFTDAEGSGLDHTYLSFTEDTGYAVNLVYPGSTFNGVLCTTVSTNCGGESSAVGGAASFLGTTTVTAVISTSPPSMTPEPSGFVLLGTGLLCVAGTLKLRLP